jgi:hypothetical protein
MIIIDRAGWEGSHHGDPVDYHLREKDLQEDKNGHNEFVETIKSGVCLCLFAARRCATMNQCDKFNVRNQNSHVASTNASTTGQNDCTHGTQVYHPLSQIGAPEAGKIISLKYGYSTSDSFGSPNQNPQNYGKPCKITQSVESH